MKITTDEFKHIADLSRLQFDGQALADMGEHLEKVLGYFETLDAADTGSVQPTAHILSAVNVLRDDVAGTPMPREQLLQNAPDSDGESYLVPQVLE